MSDSLLVTVIIEAGLVEVSVPVPRGCTVASLKEELARTDFTGTLKADAIRLCIATATAGDLQVGEPLGDGVALTERHLSLRLCQDMQLLVPSGNFEEVYPMGLAGLSGGDTSLLTQALRQHFQDRYRLMYCNRLTFEISPATPGIDVKVVGPDVVTTMLRMGLQKNHGEPRERRRRAQTKPKAPASAALVAGPDAVSPEAFARNLATARAACAAQEGLRLVFLDIDGVLNRGSSMEGILPECAERLARLVRAVDAHIVLSTTWRFSEEGRLDVLSALLAAGLPPESVVGQTPEAPSSDMCGERADEILAWMRDAEHVTAWVALDDLDLPCDGPLQGHFVRTNAHTGLSDANVASAQRILASGASLTAG